MVKNPLVCFFDSGIGGLCLMVECVRRLPNVDFMYFADNENVPYGSMDDNQMFRLVAYIFAEIEKLNPAAAVVACNTVTARCIDWLRSKYTFEIIGIQPAVKPAAAIGGRCLVLATQATAESIALKCLVREYGRENTEVYACPHLATYIENNVKSISKEEVIEYLPNIACDSVVLGCTHYIFIKNIIKDYYKCPIFDGIEGTSAQLCKKIGIDDHRTNRAQKVGFSGGKEWFNRDIFNFLLKQSGTKSLNLKKNPKKN